MAEVFGASTTAQEAVAGHDLRGSTAIITGGAGGIGFEAARALSGAGADVVLAVRNMAAGEKAVAELNRSLDRQGVSARTLDLASLASVRAFAAAWGGRPLDILINNAGIMMGPLERTVNGFEPNFGINHLGHFLLSESLLPALAAAKSARVIDLSSGAHLRFPVDLDDWNFERQDYDPVAAYGRSKTACALAAVAFNERHANDGIEAFSVMPGVIRTPLFRHMNNNQMEGMLQRLTLPLKTPEQGAATMVWAAVAAELKGRGGAYLEDCAIAGSATSGPPVGVAEHALDREIASRLWAISHEAVGG